MIPKIIHQVWYGNPDNAPHEYMASMAEFCTDFGWQYKLWMGEDLRSIPMVAHLQDKVGWYTNRWYLSGPSNIYRAAILFYHGGWYVDADVEMRDGKAFVEHTMQQEKLVVMSSAQRSYRFDLGEFGRVSHGIMASQPAHLIIAHLLNRLERLRLTEEDLVPSWDSTGGSLLADIMKDAPTDSYRIVHPSAFYHGRLRGDERFVEPHMMQHHDGTIHKYDNMGRVME